MKGAGQALKGANLRFLLLIVCKSFLCEAAQTYLGKLNHASHKNVFVCTCVLILNALKTEEIKNKRLCHLVWFELQ